MSEITIYGTGYVGLVTGVCLAELGHHVLCVDIDEDKINQLQKGIPTIEEKGLPELLKSNQQAGRITFTSDLNIACAHGFYHFIAVGTPESKSGAADLTFVNAVATYLMEHRTESFVIVNKSTVPVGTAGKMRDRLIKIQQEKGKSLEFDIISNPEFLKEGCAIQDCLHPDRIILGGSPQVVDKAAHDLYDVYIQQNVPVLKMDTHSSEFTKYASNAMLAAKISFMNELSVLAEKTGADIEVVRKGMAMDPRIGPHFIAPGCGYGGSCFPKDVKALQVMAEEHHLEPALLKAIGTVNQHQMSRFAQKIIDYLAQDEQPLNTKTVALWGLAFKPETDDIREAPAFYLAEAFNQQNIKIHAYDPAAMKHISQFSWIKGASSAYSALEQADVLVIATEWAEFKRADFDEILARLKKPVIFDGRNLYDLAEMKKRGFHYVSIGRPEVK